MSRTFTGAEEESSSRYFVSSLTYGLFDTCLYAVYILTKIVLAPITFGLFILTSLLDFCYKLLKLILTFVMTGIQGVQRKLRIGTFAEKIHYAVLKQNGQYLKLTDKTLEEVFTSQLYDYSIRKFMSFSEIEQEIKVTEVQFWSTVGLNFLREKFGIKHLTALTNSREKVNRFRYRLKEIDIQCTDYSLDCADASQDVFIFFNRTREQEQHKLQIDLMKVLSYIKRNLNENGYAIIGNYFNCDGDSGVFEKILEGFGFRIQMKEDITRNIIHSRRVLAKIHKNRKLAWAGVKVRELIQLAYQHDNVVSNAIRNAWHYLEEVSGVSSNSNSYSLYILEHAHQ